MRRSRLPPQPKDNPPAPDGGRGNNPAPQDRTEDAAPAANKTEPAGAAGTPDAACPTALPGVQEKAASEALWPRVAAFAQRYHNWLAWLLVLAPVVASLVYVGRYGVNVGWEDQFDKMVTLFEKWYAHSLHVSDFWNTTKEHRHFFAWILMFLLGLASNWNNLAEFYFTQGLLLVMLVLVILAMRRANPGKPYAWLSVPLAALMFSLRQNQNMLTGYQIVFSLPAATALATFFCISLMTDDSRWIRKFAAGMLCATVACFSAGQGLLVWPVGLIQLLALPQRWRRKGVFVSIWSVAWIAEWTLYFWDLTRSAKYGFAWDYLLAIGGGALYPIFLVAEIVGGLLLLLVIGAVALAFIDWRKGRHAIWLAMILFGLFTEAQTTLGRAGLGPEQAISSRYATFSLFVVIGLYGIFTSLAIEKLTRVTAALWGVLVGVAALGIALSVYEGIQVGQLWWHERDYHRFIFLTADTQPDEVLPTAPWENAPTVRKQIAVLREHGLNVFASPSNPHEHWVSEHEPLPILSTPAKVSIGQGQINKGIIPINGIAADPTTNEPVGGVFLEIDGRFYPAYYGLPQDARSFHRDFSVRQLGTGQHTFRAWVLAGDRRAYYQPPVMMTFTIPVVPDAPEKP